MPVPEGDWIGVLRRVVDGDRRALVQAGRLVNSFLVRWNAYDLHDEWEDLVQEVICAAALAVRAGRLRDPQAAAGFLKATARFKYMDRLRILLRLRRGEGLPWEACVAKRERALEEGLDAEAREDLRRALARVPEKTRTALTAVYVGGLTYGEAALATGIPLGTLKRYLRDGLAQLRAELGDSLDGG
jgi:RNA polymerase sigma-70 factor (ECF subfamily)